MSAPLAATAGPWPSPAAAAAHAGAVRPRRFGSWYVAEHQLRGMRAYGWTIVIGGIGTPLLYLLGMGLGLATLLDAPIGIGPDGPVDYVTFVAPALLVTAAVSVATDEFTYVVMAGFKWRRLFWAMNASPLQPGQVAGGLVLAAGMRMVFTTVAYYALMLAFGAVGDPLRAAALPLVGLAAGMAFGIPLMAYSASLKDDSGQLAAVQRFVFTPLFLFSGTFYPLDTLPVWLHWIGWVSPLWHGAELGRWLSFGQPTPGWLVVTHAVVLLAMAVGGWVVARRLFWRRLR